MAAVIPVCLSLLHSPLLTISAQGALLFQSQAPNIWSALNNELKGNMKVGQCVIIILRGRKTLSKTYGIEITDQEVVGEQVLNKGRDIVI